MPGNLGGWLLQQTCPYIAKMSLSRLSQTQSQFNEVNERPIFLFFTVSKYTYDTEKNTFLAHEPVSRDEETRWKGDISQNESQSPSSLPKEGL